MDFDKTNELIRIAQCESGLNHNSVGDKDLTFQKDGNTYGASYGIFQVRYLPGRPEPKWLLVPKNNVRYAIQMAKTQGFKPWTCAKVLGIK